MQFFKPLKESTIAGSYTSQPDLEQDLHYRGEDYLGACTHPETAREAEIA